VRILHPIAGKLRRWPAWASPCFAGAVAFAGGDMADLQNLGNPTTLLSALFSAICGYVFFACACKKKRFLRYLTLFLLPLYVHFLSQL
jgi:hypothetical protein